MRETETQLVKACLQWLALKGVAAWRQNTGAMVASYKGKRRFVQFGRPGMSDILGLLPRQGGRFLAIECKLPGRKLSTTQEGFLADIIASGGVGIVVHSIDELQQEFAVLERLEPKR